VPVRAAPLLAALSRLCGDLLAETGADRVTVRLDRPDFGLRVDRVAAEALAPGVPALARDASIDQRRLETIRWLDTHRIVLVQNDFGAAPFPPAALIEAYGVRAQILVPLGTCAPLPGWVSVHSCRERVWHPDDVRNAQTRSVAVAQLLGLDGGPDSGARIGASTQD